MRRSNHPRGRGIAARAAAAAALAALVLGAAGVCAAQDRTDPPTNIDRMRELSRSVADELVRFDGVAAPQSVRLVPAASDEPHQFLDAILADALRARGVVPHVADVAAGDGAPAALELRYRAIVFDLAYTDVYRAHLVGGRRVRRHAAVEVSAQLVDPTDGTVVWTGDARRSVDDVVPASELARVQAGAFAFARPEMPSSGWGRYAEPVIVSGIVVGLVYLFFSNQNSNGSQ